MKKKVVIFGSTGSLGYSFLNLFLKRGYKIISISSSKLSQKDENIEHHKIDLSLRDNFSLVKNIFKNNIENIELIIFCTGGITISSFKKINLEKFYGDLNKNALVLIESIKFILDFGKNINVISIISNASLHGMQNMSSYSISKSMLKNFLESLRLEMPNSKIMTVFPGKLNSKFDDKAFVVEENFNFRTKGQGENCEKVAKKFFSDSLYEKLLKKYFNS